MSFARGDTSWKRCTGGAEKLLRLYDLQRPEAPPVGACGGGGHGGGGGKGKFRWLASTAACLPVRHNSPDPGPVAPPAAEFGPAPDNIRCTHWIADNQLLLVSYLDKPNIE